MGESEKLREILKRTEQSLTSIASGARNYIDGPSVSALLRDIRDALEQDGRMSGRDLTAERERWAEVEASQFDKTSAAIRESGERWRTMEPSAETMNMAQACFLKADAWADAARSLRQPYFARLEQDRNQ